VTLRLGKIAEGDRRLAAWSVTHKNGYPTAADFVRGWTCLTSLHFGYIVIIDLNISEDVWMRRDAKGSGGWRKRVGTG
jgi:hypothetical protein